jgi:YD repeat-containing protein
MQIKGLFALLWWSLISSSTLLGQLPFKMYEIRPDPQMQQFYRNRGVKAYFLTNYQVYKGDTLTRGVYKSVRFDQQGRTIYDSTATVMGRAYEMLYNDRGQLAQIVKRTVKGKGFFLLEYDSLGRKVLEIEISHRLDTNEVSRFVYDTQNRLLEKHSRNPATSSVTTYAYDRENRLVSQLTKTQTIKGEIQTGERYLFNAQGNMIGIRGLKDGVVRMVDDYRYNERGQVIERTLPGKVERYQYYYDGTGLLTGVEVYDLQKGNLKGWQIIAYEFH